MRHYQTVVYCTGTAADAEYVLLTSEYGGIIVSPGSQILFRNDKNATVDANADEAAVKAADFISITCRD